MINKNIIEAFKIVATEKGIDKIEKLSQTYGILKKNNFYDPQNISLVPHINQALKANLLFAKDKEKTESEKSQEELEPINDELDTESYDHHSNTV